MAINERTTRAMVISFSFLFALQGFDSALCQTSTANPVEATQQKADKTKQPIPHKPPRVVSDLAQFHLDRGPGAKPPTQMGAGSRGAAQLSLVLCAPTLGLSSSTRPLFQWRVIGGDTSHVTFTLLNSLGDVLYETDVNGTSMQYSAQDPALEPGQTYSWKVSGRVMDKLPEPVMIQLQTKAEHDAVQKQAAADDASDPLSHAQVYLQNQLWYDTIASLEKSIGEHPERKDLKEQLAALYQQVVPMCVAR
jgi:Domain of Unknown Function (DUF928)